MLKILDVNVENPQEDENEDSESQEISVGGGDGDGDGDEDGDSSDGTPSDKPELTDKSEKTITKFLNKQKKFMDGDISKKGLSKKDKSRWTAC